MSSFGSQSAKAKAAAVVEDLTGGFTANETVPETDTSTTARGSATDDVVGGESVGGLASKANNEAASRHTDPDAEPPRLNKDQKPDITTETAPTTTSARKTAPTFDTDKAPPNDKEPA